MSGRIKHHIFWDILIGIIIFLMSTYTIFNGNLYHYLLGPIKQLNPEIFSTDFIVLAQEVFVPQFLTNAIYVLFLKTGLSYNIINFILYTLSYAVFAGGIIAISRHSLKQYSFVMVGMILLLSLYSRATHPVGGNLVWATMFKYDNMAMCFVPWSIYFVLQKKWWYAFIFCIIATLFHFHVGIYCAVFFVPFLVYDSIKSQEPKKILAMAPWIILCFGMYAIMSFQNTISSDIFSNAEFIKVFAVFRNSHHMVPSTWGIQAYINFIALIITTFFLTHVLRSYLVNKGLHFNRLLLYSVSIMAFFIIINFVFVEIYPLSLAVKLQPGRVIPMFSFILYMVLGYFSALCFEDKVLGPLLFLVCISLISVVFSGIIALFFSIIIAVYLFLSNKNEVNISTLTITITVLSTFVLIVMLNILLKERLEYSLFHYIHKYFYPVSIIGLFYIISFCVHSLQKNNMRMRIFKLLSVIIVVIALIFVPWINKLTFSKPYIEIKTFDQRYKGNGIDESLEILALRFKDNASQNAVVLGNPYDDQVAGFRFYSQRSSVITYKNVPQNDPALNEWINRLLDLGAAYKKNDGYYGKDFDAFFTLDTQALLDFCDKYSVTHILTNESIESIEQKYIPANFSIFDREGGWVILKRN